MKKTDVRNAIAERQRNAIRAVMERYNLRVDPWCKKANISEGTLRNFLNGDSDSIGAGNLELLANAAKISVGELLGEEVHYKADDALMAEAAEAIQAAAISQNKKLTLADAMTYTVMLYNHVMEFRKNGKEIAPNEENAYLIIKNG